ncbi:MAG: hypothetical protein MUF87_12530 [Anaerolineae bacterium]|jgi:tetratricopeptide (TPR) repeat protein|nr:hypothetical protein [Anaerolineae bacterium]
MNNAKTWIQTLRQRPFDLPWFHTIAPELYRDIEAGLKERKKREGFIEVLIESERYLPTQTQFEPWRILLNQATEIASRIPNIPLRCQTLLSYANFLSAFSKVDLAESLYEQSIDLAYTHDLQIELIRAYIGLMFLNRHRPVKRIAPQDIIEIITYRCNLRDPKLSTRLYQAVAYALRFNGDTEQSLNYAYIAFIFWKRLESPLEIARSAQAIAETYLTQGNTEASDTWFALSGVYFLQCEYRWQYGEVLLQRGKIAYDQEDYNKSAEMYGFALTEYLQLDDYFKQAETYHRIAEALMMLGQFDQAEKHLNTADQSMRVLNNRIQELYIYYTRSLLTIKRNDQASALEMVEEGLQRSRRLLKEDYKQHLTQLFETLQQQLQLTDSSTPQLMD